MGDRIFGAKGAGQQQSSRTPVEAPDSLQSIATARVLMLMGLGQFAGPDGDLLQSIYLDGVPLKSADGTLNFERVTAEWRAGTQNQDRVDGFSEIETEYGVGVEVKAAAPATRQIDDLDADAVRITVSVPALVEVNANNGDTNPTSVQMGIDLKPAIGTWQQVKTVHINGKTRSKYQRSVRIPLDGAGPWQLRVRRITADSGTQNLQNATAWDSYTVINDAPLRYPNYALLALRFDAKAFSSFPKIEVRWRLAILQVPSNYDPVARSYSGPWDGTFKPAWSNNPAWWLWTYATDPRYNVNIPPGAWKWDLYRIAQWCDQLVSDGQGGTRPRFTCNFIQSESVDAWKVLQDIASVFCGRVIPFAGGVRVTADIPGDVPAKHFMPANVKDGRFTYSSTELADRHTVAVVSLIDPDDGDKRATEYVEHAEGLTVYGYQPVEVAAVGCTDRAQAQQLGRYILETAQSETEMVSFGTGTYGMDLAVGELFHVSHPPVAGGRFGGRLLLVDGVNVTLDAPVTLAAGVSYSLEVPMPDGTLVRRGVTNGVGSAAAIVLAAPFPSQPVEGTTWLLVATNVEPTLWRCVRNAESRDNPAEREISGVQHDSRKWARIEQGIRIEPPPVSLLPDPGRIDAVSAVAVREVSYLRPDGARAVRLDIDWPSLSYPYLRGYVVGIRQAGGDWRELPEQAANHAEVPDIAPGNWQVRVAAVSVTGLRSIPTVSDIAAEGHTAPPSRPGFTATGGAMRVDFTITWPSPDCVRAELYGSSDAGDPNPAKLTDLAYPATTWAQLGVSTGVTLHYWLRVVDTWGNRSAAATATATTVKDPSILLQQLQGAVGRGALDALVGGSIDQVPSLTALRDITVPALASKVDVVVPQLADLQQRVIPQLNAAGEAAAEAALRLVLDADKRVREARRNARLLNAVIETDPVSGQIRLKATAEVTTDVDAAIREVRFLVDALNGQLTGTVTSVTSQAGRLSAAESKLDLLQTQISLGVQQALAYTDSAVSSNINGLADVQKQLGTLSETQLRAALATDQQRADQRGLKVSMAQAKLDIKANADAIAAQASATLTLAARLGSAEAGLLVEQQARSAADQAAASQLEAMQAAIGINGAAISDERSVRAAEDAALGQRIDTVQAVAADNAAAITTTQAALADQGKAQASRSDSMQADYTRQADAAGNAALASALAADQQASAARGTRVSVASLTRQQQATADALQAEVVVREQLAAQVGVVSGAVQSESVARATADTALGQRIDTVQATAAASAAAIQSEATARATADTALGQRIDTVQATATANAAAIQSETTARATADTALGQRIDTVQATAAANAAAIQSETTARATEDAALGQRIDTVQAAAAANAAVIQSETTARATADTALGQRIDTVQATAAANAAAIQSETAARATADTALGQRIDTVQAAAAANAAVIQSETTARATADTALGQRIDTVQAAAAANAAAIQSETTARATAVETVAQQVTTLQTTVDGNTASIQAQASSINGLKVQYTFKLGAGGKLGGWGAYADENGVAFDFLADRFSVSKPDGSGSRQVFAVGSVGGVGAVGVAGDLILDGAMTARHITAEAAEFVLLRAKSVWAQTGYIGALSELTANAGIVVSGRLQNGATLAASTAIIDLDARGSQPFLQVTNRNSGRQDVLVTADGYVQVARQVVSEPDIRAAGVVGLDSGLLQPGAAWTYVIDTSYQASTVWTDAPSEQLIGAATISGGTSQSGGGTGLMHVDVMYGDGLGASGYVDGRVYLWVTYRHVGSGPIRITQLSWKLARV